ncbi:mitochondrial dicarboxylate/tricarboxylate transporter DTC-like [Trifolium pratense]|uniref:mitochondrial dicarboxylate/tricarboxylate transporter DTC-like n=1 Tax=Trifolium pratense TaxID=57577 RepID=UPI001E692689|nr:mitochondrial dicarboxylate/tricarboxylate transporter DTC-like [Trifolium pratense]
MLKYQVFDAYYKALSAMLLMKYTSFIARLELFLDTPIGVTTDDDRCLPLLKFIALIAIRSVGTCESFFHCVEFIKDTIGLHEIIAVVGANFASIFFAAACSLPVRYVMIEIQKMKPDAEGKYPYTGFVDCAVKTFKAGGLFKFYTEFLLYCEQISPSCLVACMFLNQLRQTWERHVSLMKTSEA